MIQGFEIIWKIEEVDSPRFIESEFSLGMIEALVTSKNINYISTFNFVLEEIRKFTNNESRER